MEDIKGEVSPLGYTISPKFRYIFWSNIAPFFLWVLLFVSPCSWLLIFSLHKLLLFSFLPLNFHTICFIFNIYLLTNSFLFYLYFPFYFLSFIFFSLFFSRAFTWGKKVKLPFYSLCTFLFYLYFPLGSIYFFQFFARLTFKLNFPSIKLLNKSIKPIEI